MSHNPEPAQYLVARLQEEGRGRAVRLGVVDAEAVLDDLVDGHDRDAVVGGEPLEEPEARRRAVLAEHLADHRDRRQPREPREIDRGFGVPTALEHSTRTGAEREHMAGAGEVAGPAPGVEHLADGERTVGGADAAARGTWSIDTVNAVSLPATSGATIGPMSSSSSRRMSHGMHTRPRAQRSMKFTDSGVTQLAAIVRSPSFSRSSSSTTSTISPRRMRFSASSTVARFEFMWFLREG